MSWNLRAVMLPRFVVVVVVVCLCVCVCVCVCVFSVCVFCS